MFTGTTSIGNRTVGKLISEFRDSDIAFMPDTAGLNYTVRSVGDRLLKFLRQAYESVRPRPGQRLELELIIGGYDRRSYLPNLHRIDIARNTIVEIFTGDSPFGLAFGGQVDFIQRLVFGTDHKNQIRLGQRSRDLLMEYHQKVCEAIANAGITFNVPHPDSWRDELDLFNDW